MTLHNEISGSFFFLFEIEPSCILVCRQGKFQVLEFTQSMKIIKMMVEVTNFPAAGKLAEDAHQATLSITVPGALVYSGVRSSVRPQGAAHPWFSPCQPFIKFSFSNYLSIYLSVYFSLSFHVVTFFNTKLTLTMCSGSWCGMLWTKHNDLWAGKPTQRQRKGSLPWFISHLYFLFLFTILIDLYSEHRAAFIRFPWSSSGRQLGSICSQKRSSRSCFCPRKSLKSRWTFIDSKINAIDWEGRRRADVRMRALGKGEKGWGRYGWRAEGRTVEGRMKGIGRKGRKKWAMGGARWLRISMTRVRNQNQM